VGAGVAIVSLTALPAANAARHANTGPKLTLAKARADVAAARKPMTTFTGPTTSPGAVPSGKSVVSIYSVPAPLPQRSAAGVVAAAKAIGIEQYPRSGLGASLMLDNGNQFVYLESKAHGLGFCPVARFRDRMLLEGEEQFGIVEPLIDIQRRIDETTFGMLTAQYFAAFKQRYVIGWVPESEQEKLKAEVSSFWSFKDDPTQVKVGEFTETDLTRYITSKDSALGDMAAIAQVPAATLGKSAAAMRNVSPEAVASNDAGQDRTWRGDENVVR